MIGAGDRRFSGREAEDDRAPGRDDRGMRALDLGGVRVIGTAHVVHLDQVDAPGCVEREHAVVIGLRAGLAHVDAVHVRVPGADAGGVGDVAGAVFRPEHRQVALHRQPRNAAHQVDAEPQAERVDAVGKRAEALAAGAGREAVRRGQQPAVIVHHRLRLGRVGVAACPRLVPLDIDGEDIIARRQQLFCHDRRGLDRLRLGDRRRKTVPAVPAHRRGRREQARCVLRTRRPRRTDRAGRQSAGEKRAAVERQRHAQLTRNVAEARSAGRVAVPNATPPPV